MQGSANENQLSPLAHRNTVRPLMARFSPHQRLDSASPGAPPWTRVQSSRRSLDCEKKGPESLLQGHLGFSSNHRRIRAELEAEEAREGFAKRKEADARPTCAGPGQYVEDFLEPWSTSWIFMRTMPILATECTSRHESYHAGWEQDRSQDKRNSY